jgi:peptidoglycan/LPS O-acetylase OafA/YrhL
VEPATLSRGSRLLLILRTGIEYLVPTYNLTIARYGFAEVNRLCISPYWSLSIEDQFYLLLPLLFLAFPSNAARFKLALGVAAAGAFVVRPLFHVLFSKEYTINALYSSSITNFDGLFLGVAMGILFAGIGVSGEKRVTPTARGLLGARAVIALSFLFIWLYPNLHGDGTDRGRDVMHCYIVITALSALCVWLCASFESRGKDPLKIAVVGPVLDYLGARSYTLYVFHMIVAKVAKFGLVEPLFGTSGAKGLILAALYVLLLAGVTELVHRGIEIPLRERGKRTGAELGRALVVA